MNSKTQLIQYFKQFPNTQLVEHFLKLLRYSFEHLSLKEDANNLLCSIHTNSNALYIQLNNIPILIHKVRDRKHYIEFLCFQKDREQLSNLQNFQPSKQKIGKELGGMARFQLSSYSLTNQALIQLWFSAVQAIDKAPKKKNNNRMANNPWIYRAAMDLFVHNDLLKEIESKDKYLSIIPKAIHQLLQQETVQEVQKATDFWFQKAQVILEKFRAIDLPLEVYEDFWADYQNFEGRYDAFVTQAKDQALYADLALLLGQLVAYIDEKATAKQSWNEYKDKRCLATTGIRQNLWVQQLLQYKQAGNNLAAITTPTIKNALLFLLHPETHSPILSLSHQRQIANHLLDSTYQASSFSLQLVSYFNKFELSAASFNNYTYLIKLLLYAPSVQDLWKYTEEDIYYDEVLHQQVAEPTNGYKIASNTRFPLNQILYGPPGTGKTFESIRRAIAIVENKHWTVIQQMDANTIQKRIEAHLNTGQVVFTTFHQAMSYEDFVEGIKPMVVNDQIHYSIQDGMLKKMVQHALQEPDKLFVLIIDELNRGNVANIFGELITLLEEDKRLQALNALKVQLPYSKKLFALPPNLYLIATMNTTDRSIEQLDMALRRRFSFIEMLPDSILLSEDIEGVNIRLMHQVINKRIALLLDKHHLLGHSYFMPIGSLDDLQQVFKTQIIPLLLEYFYGDLGKIGLVLGKDFLIAQKVEYKHFADFDYEGMDRSWDKPIYEINEFPLPKETYLNIYK
ncbi:McrB family protein [Aureispira anguillae]|uniref:AAA family ATPase n=1 Tax=Aureispira anguillae TaxID=2864201 RepID=A0A916DTR0_9BACT|nr:AAA family ATPase [Aureispira anguillae]BDS12012.1 AAA family ATPase [Aureispira anguillae]